MTDRTTPTEGLQEALSQASTSEVSLRTRHLTWVRALITLAIFLSAACVSYWHPLAGFGLVCSVLLVYLRPQVPGEGLEREAPEKRNAARNLTGRRGRIQWLDCS